MLQQTERSCPQSFVRRKSFQGLAHHPGCRARRPARILRVAAEGKPGDRQPWDFGRFVKTLLFFNEPPPLPKILERIVKAPLQLLQGAASGDVEAQKGAVMTVLAPGAREGQGTSAGPQQGPAYTPGTQVVMVAGATGGVGKRVVKLLLQQGRTVRALVRDLPKATAMLSPLSVGTPGRLEVVAADITQKATLLPEMFANVRAIVCCTAVKVQPKEGDTPDRAKYMQGIKFYDPEIVGDTPETVEYVGMQNLVQAVKCHLGQTNGQTVFDPRDKATTLTWGALDDVVMGGVSESQFVISQIGGEEGGPVGLFTGVVRTENNGGFASVCTRNYEPVLDLGAYAGVKLRVKGTGQRFKMIIRTDSNWDSIAFCKSFDTTADQWETIDLPFEDFFPVFRAKTLKDGPGLDPSRITSMQLMLSKFEYDGELNPTFTPGPFSLPVQSMMAYMPANLAPRFVHVGSAGVTRPNRPGINVDQEPPAVKLNDALGGILTFKLKGEDVIRDSGIPFAIVRPTALTEEPAGAPLEVDQGDVIKGKISREDVAELCVKLLSLPVALDTTFEIKSTVPFSQPWEVDSTSLQPRDWQSLLEGANLRQGVTGKTVEGVYTGKQTEEEALSATRKDTVPA